MRATQPEFVLIENVKQWLDWGELDEAGRPIPCKKGKLFNELIYKPIKQLGYSIEPRLLCCADYGDPTTRERLFVICRRDKGKITWPEATHAKDPECRGLLPWQPASSIIDWTFPSKSIFDRSKPLCANTIRRIEHGVRGWGEFAEPFLVIMRGKSATRNVGMPIPTLTTGSHLGLIQPVLVKHYGTSNTAKISDPLGTITAGGNKYGLLQPFLLGQQSCSAARSVENPVPTIATAGAIGLCQPFLVKFYGTAKTASLADPLDTVTTKGRFGLVQAALSGEVAVDLHYRMLQPHELAAAMSFDPDYVFTGNQGDQIRQIGNAVPVRTAEALVSHMLKVHRMVGLRYI
jgi:DNA (cytosine-5)-methyltransferase 1